MTRRQASRDEPGRRTRPFHLPHLHRPRLPRWQQLVLAGLVVAAGIFLAFRHPEALRSTVEMLSPPIRTPGETLVADRPAEEAVLERQRQGLMTLVQELARGPLVSRDAGRVLFLVDQSLVAALLATQVPREYVIEDTYRVWITGARITFEDGLALVRLDGRASLVGSEEQVFADVAVFGDLEILRQQPSAAVLKARINLIAMDVRRVEVAGKRDVDKLVERLGKARLSAFAALASDLEIPVRHEHEIDMPAVDEGPVRIEASTLGLRLTLVDVRAFKGRLWISMAASFDAAASPPPAPVRTLPVPAASPPDKEPPAQRVARLEQEVAQLRRRVAEAAAQDPLVAKGSAAEGHLTAFVFPALFEDVVRRIFAHYLDRVNVQLDGLHVEKSGEIHKNTSLFGSIEAGEWTASIVFPRVRGALRAGEPRIRLPGGNRVLVEMPVHLEEGTGTAEVHFEWDSRALVNILCRDFEVEETMEGSIAHRDYPVSGQFTLQAGPDDLVALPTFDDRFRIHPVLDPASWLKVRRAIEAQDKFERCGMGLEPDTVMGQLEALLDAGFVVKLPKKLFRPVRLPTKLTPTVRVQDKDVDVELTQSRLEAGPDGVWYGVWVKAGLPGPRGAGPVR